MKNNIKWMRGRRVVVREWKLKGGDKIVIGGKGRFCGLHCYDGLVDQPSDISG